MGKFKTPGPPPVTRPLGLLASITFYRGHYGYHQTGNHGLVLIFVILDLRLPSTVSNVMDAYLFSILVFHAGKERLSSWNGWNVQFVWKPQGELPFTAAKKDTLFAR